MKKFIIALNLFFVVNMTAQVQVSNFTLNEGYQSYPDGYIKFRNKLFFIAETFESGREIWSTDGTVSNTTILKDIIPGDGNGITSTITPAILNNELYFIAKNTGISGEIWKTDGTDVGTTMVTSYIGRINKLTTVGNIIYFTTRMTNLSLQVWTTNGTAQGTTMVIDGISSTGTSFEGKVNDTFIFTATEGTTNDSKVWRSNGTILGTFPLTGLLDGNGSSLASGTNGLSQYIEYNNKLYFVSRYYLHATDGTVTNTNTIGSLWNAQTNLVTFSDVIKINNKLYFSLFFKENSKLLIFESNGTQAGTTQIYSMQGNSYFMPSFLYKDEENNLIFTSGNDTGGTSLQSLNTINYEVSDIIEIDTNINPPFIFSGSLHACTVDKITNDQYFITSNLGNTSKKGWIFNESTNTINNIPELNYISYNIVYNQELYYTYIGQVWKYANSLSIEPIINTPKIDLYPNPSSDFVNLRSSDEIENISIYDVNGRFIANPKFNNQQIDISKLQRGTYLIKINFEGNTVTKKIFRK